VDRNRCRELGYQALEEYEDGQALGVHPDEGHRDEGHRDERQPDEPESARRGRRPRGEERPAWPFAPAPDGSVRGLPPS
jgi:hypothetical protein